MAERGSGLAARFRRALQSEEEARREAELAAQRQAEEARAAREALFDELKAFAEETGFLTAQRYPDGVTLRWHMRYLHFEVMGEGDGVRVEFEGAPEEVHALYREAQLGHRWVWVAKRGRREDRQPLFDKGLEELLVRALGLPRPTDPDEEPGSGEGGARRRL